MLPIALLSVFAACALAAWAAAGRLQERAAIQSSLRQLEGYDVETVRAVELRQNAGTRIALPVASWLVGLGRRFTPGDYIVKSATKLTQAGKGRADDLDRFLAIRVVTVALIPVAFFVCFWLLELTGTTGLLTFGFIALVLLLGPDAQLNRQVAERQYAIQMKLPDVLDLLTISVEAGLGFEQALDRTVSSVPGPLSDEFSRMLGEVRAGASRADAMRAFEARTGVQEVKSFVLAILQADAFGVSIGRILRQQADEMRVRRRQLAQEKAQKAPVKMLFPMVFFIFPSLFVVILGPAIISIADAL
ncbi:MAG: type II secretion system F family protein [Actinomycetota bacterium]|nr:type II secretion system F family protein [Actinomycetota bacterium]